MKLLIGLFTFFVVVSAIAASEPTLPPRLQASTRLPATNPPPIITKMPISQIVTQGNKATFSISATLPPAIKGPKPKLKYQWWIKAPNSTTTNVITSATNSTLTIPKAQYANQGQYYATVSYVGSVPTTGIATLTVPTTNILAACSTNSIVGVKWDYSLTNDPAVTQFKVYYGSNTNTFSSLIVAAPQLSATLSNLLANNIYYIQATALNTNNVNKESPPSNQIVYGFTYACGVPFSIEIMMLTNNTPRLTTKLCPSCSVTVYRTTDFLNWITVGATVADQYGNIIFDDHNAPADYGFYRMSTTP